ncbi:MAG: FtsX-like permease family protein, partial [Saprospiraceae bacterium]|nr:FtsX-like permease family protein [Saprospiraceae bacterium]
IVNESFLHSTGLTENAVGSTIPFDLYDMKNSVIVGVIKDYYAFGPGSEIRPLLFYDKDDDRENVQILIRSAADRVLLEEKLSAAWGVVFDPIPFDYEYMSTAYREKFEQETKISKIAGIGSILAIFISAFGLLGLVGLTIQRRLKELSVRRVMGASNKHIVVMMIKKFALPIVISLALGISGSFYLTDKWLANYHNRIDFGWQHGTISALSVVVVLAMIVLVQTLNVTRTNPVVHLKDE